MAHIIIWDAVSTQSKGNNHLIEPLSFTTSFDRLQRIALSLEPLAKNT